MNRFLLRLLLCTVLWSPSSFAQSGWQQARGLYGGGISCLAASDSAIVAGVWYNAIFRSPDHGANWVQQNPTYMGDAISVASHAGRFYAGSTMGLYCSSDNGDHWFSPSSDMAYRLVQCFAFTDDAMFAGASDGIYVSSDSGSHWTAINRNLSPSSVTAVAILDTFAFIATPSGIYRTGQHDTTWTHADSGITSTNIWSLIAKGDSLLVGFYNGVYASTDKGAHWHRADFGLPIQYPAGLASAGPYLFVGDAGGGLYRSTDNGSTWAAAETGLGNTSIHAFATQGSTLFAGTAAGVYRSTDLGMTWSMASNGMSALDVYSIVQFPGAHGDSSLFAGTSAGVYHSTDHGATWNCISANFVDDECGALRFLGTTLLAPLGGLMGRTTDAGAHWNTSPHGLSGVYGMSIVANHHGDTVIFACQYGMQRSTDRGGTWIYAQSGLTDLNIWSMGSVDSVVFAGTPSGPFKSTDLGNSWAPAGSGLAGIDVESFATSPLDPTGRTLFAGTTQGVYSTTDFGTTWTAVGSTAGMGYFCVMGMDFWGSNIFAGSVNNGTYLLPAGGSDWQREFGPGSVRSVVITPEEGSASSAYLLAGTKGAGLWRRPLSEMVTGIAEDRHQGAEAFALMQNFPNPCNPSATIAYNIAEGRQYGVSSGQKDGARVQVELAVYDLLGREVAVLVNGYQTPGQHSVVFDGTRLASGVYVYRLMAGGQALARKLVLLR